MPTARIIWNGSPGEAWANDTGKVKYQMVCDLVHTCGVCLQYHLAISNWWPIPFHRNCRCRQLLVKPGQSARPFEDFREILRDLDPTQQTEAIGQSNYRLLESGLASWDDIVTPTRVRDLKEVVARKKLSIDQMERAGVSPRFAREAYGAVHTPEQILIRQQRKVLVERIEKAGFSREQIKEAVARDIHRRASIAAGPSKSSPMPTPRANLGAEPASPFLPPEIPRAIRGFAPTPPPSAATARPPVRPGVTKVHPQATPNPAVERAARLANAAGYNVAIMPASEFANPDTAAIYSPKKDFIAINAAADFWRDVPANMRHNERVRWFSSGDEDHVIVHEIGHGEHFRRIGRTEANIDLMKGPPNPAIIDAIRRHVGVYAAKNRAEVVAEVYAGLKAGRTYPDEILAYYRKLGGPPT